MKKCVACHVCYAPGEGGEACQAGDKFIVPYAIGNILTPPSMTRCPAYSAIHTECAKATTA